MGVQPYLHQPGVLLRDHREQVAETTTMPCRTVLGWRQHLTKALSGRGHHSTVAPSYSPQ